MERMLVWGILTYTRKGSFFGDAEQLATAATGGDQRADVDIAGRDHPVKWGGDGLVLFELFEA